MCSSGQTRTATMNSDWDLDKKRIPGSRVQREYGEYGVGGEGCIKEHYGQIINIVQRFKTSVGLVFSFLLVSPHSPHSHHPSSLVDLMIQGYRKKKMVERQKDHKLCRLSEVCPRHKIGWQWWTNHVSLASGEKKMLPEAGQCHSWGIFLHCEIRQIIEHCYLIFHRYIYSNNKINFPLVLHHFSPLGS